MTSVDFLVVPKPKANQTTTSSSRSTTAARPGLAFWPDRPVTAAEIPYENQPLKDGDRMVVRNFGACTATCASSGFNEIPPLERLFCRCNDNLGKPDRSFRE